MAPNRASSPTGMLWAHQLKREHGFLLDRMKKLETEINKVQSTAAKAARNTSAGTDIAAIAQQVQALSEDGGSYAADKIRREIMERLETVEAGVESISIKLGRLDDESEQQEAERKQAFVNEKALLRQVKEVEGRLNEYEKNLNAIGDEVNQGQMDVIRGQLAKVFEQVKREGSDREMFGRNLKALEEVTKELKEDNEKLRKDMEVVGKRAAVPTAQMMVPLPAGAAVPAGTANNNGMKNAQAPPTANQKTTRKGRGQACSSCRLARRACNHDTTASIANEEEDAIEDPAPVRPAASSSKAKAPAKTAPPRQPQAQNKPTRTAEAIKQEIVETQQPQARSKTPAARGLAREIERLKADTQYIKREPMTQRAAQKPIILSGQGWVGVPRTPSDEQSRGLAQSSQDSLADATAAERIKRGRGRPRKNIEETQAPAAATAAPAAVLAQPKRGRGRPRKDSSQASAQATSAGITKRGRGRPRKDSSQAQVQPPAPTTTKRAPGRPRRKIEPSSPAPPPPAAPTHKRRPIKQEPGAESRAQPLREAKVVQTTEASPLRMIKKEPGLESKRSALEALRAKKAMESSQEDEEGEAPPPKTQGKGKRKAVEPPPAPQRAPRKRRVIE